jgi:pimeloyl-ACP methyl ester carboxylesterase
LALTKDTTLPTLLARILMIWIALPLALGYAAVCGLMYARQRDLVYYPQLTRVDAAKTDFALPVADGVVLRGWVVNPGQPRALIYFGGNAESVEVNRDTFGHWFPGHTVYLVAYRGFGASDGSPSEQDLTADALALFDHVRARHPNGQIDVIGRSLGSGVASAVAARRPVRRLALVTPFDSLVDVGKQHYPWLPVDLIAQDRYDSVTNLAHYPGPLLVVRAGRDEVVPPANTQRLLTSLTRPVQVLEIPQADHSNVGADPAFARTLKGFFSGP